MSNWQEMEKKYLFTNTVRWPILPVKGKGSYLWDENGQKVSGFGRRVGGLLFRTQSSGDDKSPHQAIENTRPVRAAIL